MDKKDLDLNRRLMMEVGFDVGNHRRLVDQDTGTEIKFEGRYMVAPDSKSGRNSVEFDPVNNVKQMSSIFGYYNQKVACESDGQEEIKTYFPVETDASTGKGYIEARTQDGVIRSNEYVSDSLKYVDLIMKMNGATNVDLSEYDKSREELAMKRKEIRASERKIYGQGGRKHKDGG